MCDIFMYLIIFSDANTEFKCWSNMNRPSEYNSKKDGFYENSFLDNNSDPENRDNSPEVKQTQSNAKAKPFDFGATKKTRR